ncbi:hypothetical protein, partial [Mannheimia haemolytica]|uniref:hypothetical protein n=1 Tax=Mannheimia haemolytica TaxID=75985 RepID=UPI001EE23C72
FKLFPVSKLSFLKKIWSFAERGENLRASNLSKLNAMVINNISNKPYEVTSLYAKRIRNSKYFLRFDIIIKMQKIPKILTI